jgi:hypothetical protein
MDPESERRKKMALSAVLAAGVLGFGGLAWMLKTEPRHAPDAAPAAGAPPKAPTGIEQPDDSGYAYPTHPGVEVSTAAAARNDEALAKAALPREAVGGSAAPGGAVEEGLSVEDEPQVWMPLAGKPAPAVEDAATLAAHLSAQGLSVPLAADAHRAFIRPRDGDFSFDADVNGDGRPDFARVLSKDGDGWTRLWVSGKEGYTEYELQNVRAASGSRKNCLMVRFDGKEVVTNDPVGDCAPGSAYDDVFMCSRSFSWRDGRLHGGNTYCHG